MTDAYLARAAKKTPYRIRFRLRDGRVVEGMLHLTERDALANYLATRKRCVSLTDADWIGTGAPRMPHVVLPTATIVWATPVSEGVQLVQIAPAAQPRDVEIQLEEGINLRASMYLIPDQRLSDWFDAADTFVPLMGVQAFPRTTELGEMALARDCVSMVREVTE